jgi:LuxR family maltose regulon positive regulatory protein
LVEAVRVQFPAFGERTRKLLHQGEIRDLRGIIGTLVNELADDIPGYLVIVLDEYHTVDQEDSVNQVLGLLLQYLPEHIHLIVAGRSIPPISIIHLASHGQVAGLGTDQLRFTVEEVRAVLEHHLGMHLTEEKAAQLTEESEGWITGILLGAQSVWEELISFLSKARGPLERIYAYMIDEVLHHLDPEVRSFLRRVAVLNRMEAGLCNTLLERRDSAQTLELLERRNLFLVPLEGGWYRFHGLFRESLLREAQSDWASFVRLNLRAAQLWRERGELAEVVEHLLQAQAYSEAAEEIEQLAQALFHRGHWRRLVRWIEALPEAVQQHYPRLLLHLGLVYREIGQGKEADRVLESAEHLLLERNDLEGWTYAATARSTRARTQGEYTEALRLAREALPHAEEAGLPALVELHRTFGICLHAQGNLVAAESHFRRAVEESHSGVQPYHQALAYQDLGVCLRALGAMSKAEAADMQALEIWQDIGNPGPIANILNNLAMAPFLRGEFQKAQVSLQQAMEAAENSLSPYFQALVRASLGDLYRNWGEFVTAQQLYAEGLERAQRARNAALTTYLLEALGNLARHQGASSEARGYLDQALACAASSRSDRARVQVSTALLEAVTEKPGAAINLLREAVDALHKSGERVQLLRAYLVQAIARQSLDQWENALISFRQALALAEDIDVIEPFVAEREMLQPFMQELPDTTLGTRLRHCLKLQPARETAVVVEQEVRPRLHIQAFGSGRVSRGEKETLVKDWGGKRPRELFFYLLFHAPVRREEAGLVLWPDQDVAQLSSSFHAVLYRARRAVGDHFVTFQEDTYHWSPQVTYCCDVDQFKQLLDQADELPSGVPMRARLLEEACSLYVGDFLEEYDSEWCVLQRELLRERYVQALLQLGEEVLNQGDIVRAQEIFQRTLEMDSLREEAYRGLMRCYIEAGERAYAVQVYHQCRRRLEQELNVAPSAETQALYRTIGPEVAFPR